ncbi:hypothetical protein ISN45_Aa03g026440 [Arabidopsis thaliana x Arabidopsis arenosa]|uniref:Uncharacterized protein n=1 Tax=Arabidopsis thaliana x Arabidopsis arenosa TaxID=1240361 RepID=A0A8T2AYT1_9BRAS|nr:hypothetical protein ISN45_Aa03g026440 [Arabidopsis thaliana x Arabidopsis arenosa]
MLRRRDFHAYANSHRYETQIVQYANGEEAVEYWNSVSVNPNGDPLLAIATRRYRINDVDRFLIHYSEVNAQVAHIPEQHPRIPLLPMVPIGPPLQEDGREKLCKPSNR